MIAWITFATVMFDFALNLMRFAFSLNLFVCLVIHDTYTLFTHAAGRIPGKDFIFDILTFKLCFSSSAVSSSLQLHLTPLSFPFPPRFRIKIMPFPRKVGCIRCLSNLMNADRHIANAELKLWFIFLVISCDWDLIWQVTSPALLLPWLSTFKKT